jgi:predicted Ser/Thr protein kinase/ketosteroid isomerase-like protein
MSNLPTHIGRYEILGAIGRGGMGSLYLALDPKLDRQLAIKLLRDDDDDLRERFAREARAAARLRHPNIVTIFDVGDHDGQPFIAMEYIQGQTLAEIVRGSVPMTLVRKLELMEALCDGLGFAHKSGIIHRDIKPANLMIDADGSLKILDFGIARAGESSGMTQAGMLIGTLNYMSPEQVSGLPVDLRSDLFAVGAVFYELVAYRQAFPGGLMAGVLNKIVSGQPEPLASVAPGVDPDVVRIIDRALEKDPNSRYSDLAAMRQDIMLVRARLAATEPMRVLGTMPGADDSGEVRSTPSPSSGSRRSTDLEGLARRRAEQIQTHVTEAEARLAAGEADAAIASAEHALLLDPTHARAHGIIDRARALIEAQQLEEALDAAAGGIASGDFQSATVFIERAAEIDPRAPKLADVRRALDEAVQRQEEARQREALEARVRDAIADAERQFADGRHDDAVAALAAFRPSHPLVAQALERLRGEATRIAEQEKLAAEESARQAAEAAERAHREEQARRTRERETAASNAIRDARRADGPVAALAILRAALERDPDNVALQRAISTHEVELQRAEAQSVEQARRQPEKAAAPMPDADVDDKTVLLKREGANPAPPVKRAPAVAPTAAIPAPTKAPETPPPPARESVPETRAAARPALTSDVRVGGETASGGVSNAVKYGGAAAAVVLLVGGFALFGGGDADSAVSDSTVAQTGASSSVTDGADLATTPLATDPSAGAAIVEEVPATVEEAGDAQAVQPPIAPPPAVTSPAQQSRPAPSPQDQQLDRLLADAQQVRGAGDLRTALERVEAGLKLRPTDSRFRELAAQLNQDGERRANAARSQAQGVGQTALAHVTWGEGEKLLADGRRLAGEGDNGQATRTFLAAETRYRTAAVEGQRAVETQRQQQEQEQARQRELEQQTASAASARATEEAAIRSVVERYRDAYNRLDANAVQSVFPSVPIGPLRTAFSRTERQSVTYANLVVNLDAAGTTATVTTATRVVAKPRGASEQTSEAPMTLTLRKNGNTWIITGRK